MIVLFLLSLTLITSCNFFNPFSSFNHPDQVRVGTFNIENFGGKDEQKLEAIAKILANNFDVVGLQEVNTEGANQLREYLSKSQAWDFILGETGGRQRIALFYRKDWLTAQKVTEWQSVNLTGTLRSPLVTYLKTGQDGFDFTLVVLHQKGGGGKDAERLRRQQSDRLRQEVNQYQQNQQSDPDLVILGDFNSPSWSDQNRGLRDAPLTFLTRDIETTAQENCLKKRGQPKTADGRPRFSNLGTGCVIDHIAVSQKPQGAEAEYIPQSLQILDPQKDLGFASDRLYFQSISDHLPVRAIFRLK